MQIIFLSCLIFGLALLTYAVWTRGGSAPSMATSPDGDPVPERQLTKADLQLLRTLVAGSASTSVGELMNSHEVFDRAAAAYVEVLRKHEAPGRSYAAAIDELTRLRRRLRWSLGAHGRFASTRDLDHGRIVAVDVGGRDVPTVVRVVDEDHFGLRFLSPDLAVGFQAGSALTCRLVRPKEGIVCFSPVVRHLSAGPPCTVDLEHATVVTLLNRREFPREETASPIVLTLPGHEAPVHGTLCDLSAGGLSFMTADPLPATTIIGVEFELGQRTPVKLALSATVTRCESTSIGREHRVNGRWNLTRTADRERLTEHVFKLQLRRLRSAHEAAKGAIEFKL